MQVSRGDPSHIDLTVTELDRSRRFCDRVLKFVGYRGGEPGADGCGWMNPKTGFNIALQVARPEHAHTRHSRYAPGLHHLALEAESRQDVDRLHELLLEMQATVLDPPGEYYPGGYYAVFFSDPDGLKLEFVHLPEYDRR
jgi:glyoxylase I family protein